MSADITGIEGALRSLCPMPISGYVNVELARRLLEPSRYGLPANASQKELVAARVNEIMFPKWIELILKVCKFALLIISSIYFPSYNALGMMPISFLAL